MFRMITEAEFASTKPFTTFQFVAIIVAGFGIGWLFSACGGDPACENGGCGPDPTSDGGTTTEDTGNPSDDAGVEDAGAADSGDKPDAGKDPCADYTWLNGDYECQATIAFESTCETWAAAEECYFKCTDMFSRMSVDSAKITLTAPGSMEYRSSAGYTATCDKQ